MSLSNNFPTIRPTLLLDFANSNRLDPRVTFTRASTATFFNELGVLTTANNDTPRFDHDPSTLQPRGLLIEEQRTNSIRNNTMQGAVAGTPGTLPTNWATYIAPTGVTRTVVGTGVQNGITYIDVRYSGTPSAASEISIYPEVASSLLFSAGAVVTWGAYLAIVAGATTNITGAFLRTLSYNGGTYLSEGNSSNLIGSLTATMQRSNFANYTVAATADRVVGALSLYATAGAAIDITLRIGLPQLEQGAFATSVIPTTTTALTRNADVASMTGTNFSSWYNAATSTVYAEWENIAASLPSNALQFVTNFSDGTGNNSQRLTQFQPANSKASQNMNASGVNPGRLDSGGAYSNAIVKAAVVFAALDRAICVNAASPTTSSTGNLPTGINQAEFGGEGAGNRINGWLRRIAYYPTRLPNAQLQALTG